MKLIVRVPLKTHCVVRLVVNQGVRDPYQQIQQKMYCLTIIIKIQI